MKITKYEHACLVIEERGKRLVIDPGELTRDMGSVTDVVATVCTHAHFDHCNAQQLAAIHAHNPQAQFLGPQEVAAAVPAIPITIVHPGNTLAIGPFQLQFFGEKHTPVIDNKPDSQNVGVLVNGIFYYPGDSFDTPNGIQPEVLALPVSGPWLKLGEAIDFLRVVQPTKFYFSTHDALYSDIGMRVAEGWLTETSTTLKVAHKVLRPGESIEI